MKKSLALLFVSLLIGLTASSLFAQANGEGSEPHHEESSLQVVARWANFIVLFGGLGVLLRKPMRDFFQKWGGDITSGLKRARDAENNAQTRIKEIEERLVH